MGMKLCLIFKYVSSFFLKDFTFLRALYYFWTPMFFITWKRFGIDLKSLIRHAGKIKWWCEPSHFSPLVVETDVVQASLLLWWKWKLWLHWYWKTSHWSWMKADLFPLRSKLHLVQGKSISFLLEEVNFKNLNSWNSSIDYTTRNMDTVLLWTLAHLCWFIMNLPVKVSFQTSLVLFVLTL